MATGGHRRKQSDPAPRRRHSGPHGGTRWAGGRPEGREGLGQSLDWGFRWEGALLPQAHCSHSGESHSSKVRGADGRDQGWRACSQCCRSPAEVPDSGGLGVGRSSRCEQGWYGLVFQEKPMTRTKPVTHTFRTWWEQFSQTQQLCRGQG